MIEKQLHGSVYVALGPGMQVYDISTEGIGEAGFRQFIDSIQHASIRKRGVPILTFGRYDMEDMRGLHFTSGQDKPATCSNVWGLPYSTTKERSCR